MKLRVEHSERGVVEWTLPDSIVNDLIAEVSDKRRKEKTLWLEEQIKRFFLALDVASMNDEFTKDFEEALFKLLERWERELEIPHPLA